MHAAACPRTAVIGADGYLGRAFHAALWAAGAATFATSRRDDTAHVRFSLEGEGAANLPFLESGTRAAIIAAGTAGARCSIDPVVSRAVNVDGVEALVHELWPRRILPVFLSTDNVFDGTLQDGGYSDDDTARPVSEYGRQKAEVERFLADSGNPFLVVRLSKVFSLVKGDGTLLDEMARSLAQGEPVRAAVDQVFCPTLREDVVRTVLDVLSAGMLGVVNVCSPEAWSRHALAAAVAESMHADTALVKPVTLDAVFPGMPPPKRTVLVCKRLQTELGSRFSPMETCIGAVAANYRSR